MRIGLYGLPTAGKTYILDAVRNFRSLSGSELLLEINPEFHKVSEEEKKQVREELALKLASMDNFIMDGHYSFGNNVVFTDKDGELYDSILYLYVAPDILKDRMGSSLRNQKYLQYDIEKWQNYEIESLREYCHLHDKDFYIIDNPEVGYFADISTVLQFIDSLAAGFSCKQFAKKISEDILKECEQGEVCLSDGDKTFIIEDSCGLIGYSTHIFDGNFYTGFQSWRHHNELADYLSYLDYTCPSIEQLDINYNEFVKTSVMNNGFILTTGYLGIWNQISKNANIPIYYGNQMSAETKFFVVKHLQERGLKVKAFGDSLNDYYMLRQSNNAYLISKSDDSISRSLTGKNLEGITIVRGRKK